jgi:hypothetical protein
MKRFLLLILLATATSAVADYGTLPLVFERNDDHFIARSAGYNVLLTGDETVLVLGNKDVVRMKLDGASANPRGTALDLQQSRSNYLVGSDPKEWKRDVPHYGKVRYDDVYPGIDAVFYGNDRRLEFDFVVAPGADPRAIAMTFDGVDALRLDRNGDLVMNVGGRELRQLAPVVYQQTASGRRAIDARYVLRGRNKAAFRLAKYDTTKPLVIDPILAYSTLHGGGYYDIGYSIAVDKSGYAYIVGQASALFNFPQTSPRLGQPEDLGYSDAFVAKFDPVGRLVYSTVIGSRGPDTAFGVAVDSTGHAYVTGEFSSNGAPLTPGAYVTTPSGADAYVFKINPQGNGVVYGARVGGTYDDRAYGIAVDAAGNAIVTGALHGTTNFPTVNAAQPVYGGGYTDGFVFKLNATGTALVYSTYLGGGTNVFNNNARVDEAKAVAVDSAGNAYVTGFTIADDFPTTPGARTEIPGTYDAFAVKYTPAGQIVYSARFGGDDYDLAWGIAVDDAGHAYVTGQTDDSTNFPVTPGAFQPTGTYDAFVSKLLPDGSGFAYSTLIGGTAGNGSDNGDDRGYAIAVNSAGEAYITGQTKSRNFPVANAIDDTFDTGGLMTDAFVTKFNAQGTGLVWSTFLGAQSWDAGRGITVDRRGNAYVTGSTSSTLFPTTPGAAQRVNGSDDGNGSAHEDAFVTKISENTPHPAPADFSGDGTSDMIWKHSSGQFMMGSEVFTTTDPNWEVKGLGEFGGDGKADMVVRHATTGQVALWEMDGRTIVNGAPILTISDANWQIIGVTDLNGDGYSEILWRYAANGTIAMWEIRNHALVKGTTIATVTDPNMQLLATGDFDGNGDTEVLWRNAATGAVTMWDMVGSALASVATVATGTDPNRRVQATGDFNGDGMIDVLWRSATTGTVSMWLLRGAHLWIDSEVRTISDFNWQIETAGDYDGNGRAEIVWRYKPNGNVALWQMNGPTLLSGATITSRDAGWTIQPRNVQLP